jgi:hypothetical protein
VLWQLLRACGCAVMGAASVPVAAAGVCTALLQCCLLGCIVTWSLLLLRSYESLSAVLYLYTVPVLQAPCSTCTTTA